MTVSLRDMVSPIAKVSYFFSLAPFVVSKNPRKQYVAVRQRPFYIIRIIILVLITEAIHIKIIQETVSPLPQELNRIIITSVRFGIFYTIFIGFPLILFTTYWNSSKLAEFMNNLKQIGEEMEKIGIRLNFRRKYKWHIFHMYFKIFQMVYGEICLLLFFNNGNLKQTTLMAFYGTPFMLSYLISIQWTSFVNLLTTHFEYLNRFLKTLKYRQCFMIEDFTQVKHKPLIEVIEECGLVYDRLCDESKRLNEAYAWQILYLIPHYFLTTLSSIYEVLLSFKNDAPLPALLQNSGIFCTLYILEFVIPSALCKQEADRFSEILNKVDLKLLKTAELEELITAIAFQTYHQKVEFSAFEIFPLDGTLLYSVIGAWSTYIVILLQFEP